MTTPRENDKTKAQEENARFVIDLNMYRNFQLKLARPNEPYTNKRGDSVVLDSAQFFFCFVPNVYGDHRSPVHIS
jgi:hypothetical protein